jgi:4,5-dihydroxyphthalate decarboxylase
MIRLRALLGNYPHTRALLSGEVSAPGVTFEFAEVSGRLPFRRFVRTNEFDVSELPLVPMLQAVGLRKSIVLLPVVMTSRFQHDAVYVRVDAEMTPRDLEGRRIACRADANTGIVWALGILQNEYGVDVSTFTLVTSEDNHVAEYLSPAGVELMPNKDLARMLADGEVDAAITETDMSADKRFKRLIPDPAAEARCWYMKHNVKPAGHVLALNAELSRNYPGLASTIFELLRRSQGGSAMTSDRPFGADPIRPTLELMIDYAMQQQLLARRVQVDELYDDATRALRS